jgi:hypothetical protein
VKRLEFLQLLAHAGELDRLARDGLQAQRRAAAGVAVQLGQDRAGDVQGLVKMVATLTASWPVAASSTSRISCGLVKSRKPHQFLHQRLVNLQAAGRVENEGVAVILPGEIQRLAGDFQDVRFPFLTKTGRTNCWPSVSNCSMAPDDRRPPRPARACGPAYGAGGPAWRWRSFCPSRAADHHDATGIAAQSQAGVGRAEQFDQFIVDDLDDLLARLNALDDLLAEGLGFDLAR